jgi:hypothetical protein
MEKNCMTRTKNELHPLPAICVVLLILLAATMFSCGCIKKVQNLTESAEGSFTVIPVNPGDATLPDATPSGGIAASVSPAPVVQMTPAKSEIATEVAPILTPDPYPIIHGLRLNETRQYSFLDRMPEYQRIYTLGGNATGLLVNVVEGPLYIVYVIEPQNDCIVDPESCRGEMLKPVQRPYLTITVRDNQTQEIVAQDGYGGTYSSDIGHYEVKVEEIKADGSTETNKYYPGPRYIAIYKEGTFHITIEGNYLDVGLSVITGASPDPLEVNEEPTYVPAGDIFKNREY